MFYRKIQQLEEATLSKEWFGKESLKFAKVSSILNFQNSTEITLKFCSICHVLFGFECFPKLNILLAILYVCVYQNTTQLYGVLNKSH